MDKKIIHDVDKKEFYLLSEGARAYLSYEVFDGRVMDLQHTVVAEALRGQGAASVLVRAACDYAEENHLLIRASCSYAAAWLKRHPEYRCTEE